MNGGKDENNLLKYMKQSENETRVNGTHNFYFVMYGDV